MAKDRKFFEVKKEGRTRMVFLVGDYAIKVPYVKCWMGFLWGCISNITEWDEHERASQRQKKFLCPLLWTSPWHIVNVFRRCSPLPPKAQERFRRRWWLKKKCLDYPCEGKVDCFGISPEGRLVVVDYGQSYRDVRKI